MSRLVLHIGAFKTGTTYLQRSMFQNRELLMSEGIGYPQFVRRANHGEYAWAVRTPLEARHREYGISTADDQHRERNRLRDATAVLTTSYSVSFLTTEHLWLIPPEQVEILRDEVLASFDRVDVVVYFRRQDYYTNSYFSQQLKEGFLDSCSPAWIESISHHFNFEQIVNKWTSAFGVGRVHAYPYLERYKDDPNTVIRQLLALLGLDPNSPALRNRWTDPERLLNESVSGEMAEMMRLLGPHVPSQTEEGYANTAQRHALIENLRVRYPGPSVKVDPNSAQRLREIYRPMNDRFRPQTTTPHWDEWFDQPAAPTLAATPLDNEEVANVMAELSAPRGPIFWGGPVTTKVDHSIRTRIHRSRRVRRMLGRE